MKRALIRCTWIALVALTLAALAFVFHPNNWQYYTDGISLRQSAREADVRIVLWEEPEELVHDFNTLTNNIEPVVSSDGRMMVFARGRAKKNADLYTAKWDGRRWSKPEPIDDINTPFDELGPELSDDLTLLYFYSDREGGLGNYDIWVSAWGGSYWDKPVNLGPAVNSPFNEYDPALAPGDDRLFFSSNRPRNLPDEAMTKSWPATLRELVSQADYDIFRAQTMAGQVITNQVSPGTNAVAYADWDPRSLAGIIPEFHPAERVALLNTGQDEGQVDFTRRGDFIYFSSNREGGMGGFDIYRSRILESLFVDVERVGRPISSTEDDMDPALWMEGHSLVFSSNRASDTGLDFVLYQSTSREVFAQFENARLAALWEWVKVNWWILLLMALGLAALWWLLKLFIDPAKRQSMDLLTKCVLASVLLHLILLFVLSLWFLSQVIVESTRGPMKLAVNDAALAKEKVSLALREEVTKLKSARSDVPMEQKIERMELPDFEPAKQLTDLHFDTPVPHDFVVDYQPVKESEVPAEAPDARDIQTELPAFAMEATAVRMETPDNKPVEANQSKPAKQPEQLDLTRIEELASTKEEAQSSEAEVHFAPPVIPDTTSRFEPDATAPTVPMMEIPEIDLQGDLPAMEFVNNPEHMESREPQPVPEPMKTAGAVQPQALEVAYTPIEALVQDIAQPVPPALTVTQVVAQSTLSSSISTSELVADAPRAEIPSTQPVFEALKLSEAMAVRMETPDNKPVEANQSKPAKQPEQLDLTRVEELASTKEEAQSSEAEVHFAPPVIPDTTSRFKPDATAPTVPMMEIPDIDLQGDLPAMEFVNNPEHMESRKPQPVPEPMKAAAAVQPKALEVAYTPIEALVEDVAQPVPPALTVTQVVTQSTLSSSASTSELVADAPRAEIPSTQPVFEALELASERTLEAPTTSAQAAPQEEQVIHQAETGELEPRLLLPFTGSPLALDSAIRSAPLPVPEPLSGTLLSLKDEIPEPLDSEGEETEWASDLPEFELGGTVSMESKPMEHMTYALRDPALREDFIEDLGGNDQTEEAINRALQFLAQAQEASGHWNIHRWGGEQGHDVAATGLALLCFMGHGAKHTESGPYHDVASRAVRWLCDQLDDKGRFKAKDMYDQGIAGIAIAEAYALTKDPELLPHVENMVDYIIRAQHPKTGGWRYQPGDPGDTSVVGWQVMALKSARLGEVKIEDGVFKRASRWLKQVGGGKHGGHYGYESKSPKPPMVAEGMFCQQLLGIPPSDRKMKESAKYLSAHLPNARQKDYYYWYYGCLSLYQHQGPIWKEWNERMREILINSQDRGGKHGGSWNPTGDAHGNRMGRIVSTALSTLSLEVYYRYLPMYSTGYGKN